MGEFKQLYVRYVKPFGYHDQEDFWKQLSISVIYDKVSWETTYPSNEKKATRCFYKDYWTL